MNNIFVFILGFISGAVALLLVLLLIAKGIYNYGQENEMYK